jgi:hypothetical protein
MLFTKDQLFRTNQLAIEHGYEFSIPLDVFPHLSDYDVYPVLDAPVVLENCVRVTVVLNAQGHIHDLDMAPETWAAFNEISTTALVPAHPTLQ